MDYFNWIKYINRWKFILILGVLLMFLGLYLHNEMPVNPKIIIGLGVGLFIVGLSYWMATKYITIYDNNNIFQTKKIIDSLTTKVMRIIGVLILLYFFVILMIELVKGTI